MFYFGYFCSVKLLYSTILFLSLSSVAWSQKDTIDYSMNVWTLDTYQRKMEVQLDTFLDGFQNYNPIYQTDYSYAFLGNTGQAAQNTIFAHRNSHAFLFLTPYTPYLFTPENVNFYHHKQHYTQTKYTTNFTKKNNLQNIDLKHSQNIAPHLNVGFQYRLLGADGQYKAQKTSNHFFRAFASYERSRYQAFLVYNYNKFNSYLNGGLTSDTLLDNPNLSYDDTKLHPVNLSESKNAILSRNINLKHHYNLMPHQATSDTINTNQRQKTYAQIGHEFDLEYNKRTYTNEGNNGFYKQYFIDSDVLDSEIASDSSSYLRFRNRAFIKFPDDSSGFLPEITLSYLWQMEHFQSYQHNFSSPDHFLAFQLSNPIFEHWNWELNGRYGIVSSDLIINGQVSYFLGHRKSHFINFSGSFSQTDPNDMLQTYHSNYFWWDNQFTEKQAISYIDLNYQNRKAKLKIGVRQEIIDNYVYFAAKQDSIWGDSTYTSLGWINAYPHQETTTFNILSAYLSHQLDWGPFHMKNELTYQKISNDSVLHLPTWVYYNSTWFEMRFFKKVLTAQTGFDLRYHSVYLADGFMPATGLFYNQYSKMLGDYPYIDLFINLKLKRSLMFFKLEHINKGANGNQYYTTVGYPMNPRVFRFGISWRMYN